MALRHAPRGRRLPPHRRRNASPRHRRAIMAQAQLRSLRSWQAKGRTKHDGHEIKTPRTMGQRWAQSLSQRLARILDIPGPILLSRCHPPQLQRRRRRRQRFLGGYTAQEQWRKPKSLALRPAGAPKALRQAPTCRRLLPHRRRHASPRQRRRALAGSAPPTASRRRLPQEQRQRCARVYGALRNRRRGSHGHRDNGTNGLRKPMRPRTPQRSRSRMARGRRT